MKPSAEMTFLYGNHITKGGMEDGSGSCDRTGAYFGGRSHVRWCDRVQYEQCGPWFWRDSQVDGGDPSVGCGGGVGLVLSRVESCGVASVGCGRVSA